MKLADAVQKRISWQLLWQASSFIWEFDDIFFALSEPFDTFNAEEL